MGGRDLSPPAAETPPSLSAARWRRARGGEWEIVLFVERRAAWRQVAKLNACSGLGGDVGKVRSQQACEPRECDAGLVGQSVECCADIGKLRGVQGPV